MQAEIYNHLQTVLQQLDVILRQAVERVKANGYDASDVLRGLVVRHEEAEHAAGESPLSGLWSHEDSLNFDFGSADVPLLRIMQAFELSHLDSLILLTALAPELDHRYQRIYGYLQDDVTLRYPTPGLMMNLFADNTHTRLNVYTRLQADNPLRKHRLLQVKAPENRVNSLFLQHVVAVEPVVLRFLLGEKSIDTALTPILQLVNTSETIQQNLHLPEEGLKHIYEALPRAPLIYMSGNTPLEHLETAYTLCSEHGMPLVQFSPVDSTIFKLPFVEVWRIALREALMRNAALFVNDWERILDEDGVLEQQIWQQLRDFPRPIFISARKKWEVEDIERQRLMLRLDFDAPDYHARYSAWQSLLTDLDFAPEQLGELAVKYRFHRQQIVKAVHTARDFAATRGRVVELEDLESAARAHTRLRLGNYAQQVDPSTSWDRLILPEEPLSQLREIVSRIRFANVVQDEWGYEEHISNSKGISALFAGESGTGKTLSAKTLASELGLPMYKIDLSGIVDKYIGETEKNLRAIFEEAQSNSAILFFDEADAIFGKRSEVKDARDRYANIEVAYMLQQIESYDGIAILATNLRQNLDEAFTRRLDFVINFPFPEPDYRYRIWLAHFPEKAPLSPNLDIMELARRYELSGGNIRNIALTAAYTAAADGQVITLEHIQHAIRREHQKMGRLLDY